MYRFLTSSRRLTPTWASARRPASVHALGVALLLAAAACKDEPGVGQNGADAAAACALDSDARLLFTSVTLDRQVSNVDFCPDIAPSQLNEQLDASSDACQIEPTSQCRANITCLVMDVDVSGLAEATGEDVYGRFDVTVPGIGRVCTYDVEASVLK